jgi:hypothetical protein
MADSGEGSASGEDKNCDLNQKVDGSEKPGLSKRYLTLSLLQLIIFCLLICHS